jgi:hypothetical protein
MDLSNKALALVLVVATSISLVGTLLTLDRLSNAGPAYQISGRASTDTGSSNFSINSSISIAFTNSIADFGAGLVNGSGAHNCTLNTTGPGMLNGAANPVNGLDCLGFIDYVQPLRIQNQGTQNVTLNITFNATAAEFIGGTTPEFGYSATQNETGACPGFNAAYQSIAQSSKNYTLCPQISAGNPGFNWVSGKRTMNLDLGMRIPQDAPTGDRKVVITAYASSP